MSDKLDFDKAVSDTLEEVADPVQRMRADRFFASAKAKAQATRWYVHMPDGEVHHTWIVGHDDVPPVVGQVLSSGYEVNFIVDFVDAETRTVKLKSVQ